jgi:uncharacterized membrane protein YadS
MMHSVTGFGALALVVILLWMGVNIAHHNSLLNPFVLAIVIGISLTFLLGGGFGDFLAVLPVTRLAALTQ